MRVYERFRALGMPEGVSFEAFGRIMGGGVGEGEDEKKRMPLNSRSRGRDQQQEEKQEEEEGRGDWNTALTFLSTHLVGRQEAMKARGLISRWVALLSLSFICMRLL
jgi:hypothetical protein